MSVATKHAVDHKCASDPCVPSSVCEYYIVTQQCAVCNIKTVTVTLCFEVEQ